jgi:hypothetical protein
MSALDRSLSAPHLAAESRDARYGVNFASRPHDDTNEQPFGSPNFGALAADIRAERADSAEREAECLARWARDVDAADAAIPHSNAEHEAALIAHLGGLLPAEAVVLLAAVFRGLAHNSHIEAHRSAMAGIADAIAELRAEFEREREALRGAFPVLVALATGDKSPEEIAANARLIAAAPELLEALRGVVRVADRATVEFDAARAAIARATGVA